MYMLRCDKAVNNIKQLGTNEGLLLLGTACFRKHLKIEECSRFDIKNARGQHYMQPTEDVWQI